MCGILSDLVLFPGCLCWFVIWVGGFTVCFGVRAVLACDFLSILFARVVQYGSGSWLLYSCFKLFVWVVPVWVSSVFGWFLFMISFGCCGLVAVWVGLWFSVFGWWVWFVVFCLCSGW